MLTVKEKKKRQALKEKERRKKKIFKAAIKLFTDNGFEDTMIADITKKAKVAYGTFYSCFSNKEDVLLYYFDMETKKSQDKIKKNMPTLQSFPEQLELLINTYWDHIIQDKGLVRIMIKERILMWGTQTNRKEGEFLTFLSRLIDDDRKRKNISNKVDSFRMAEIIVALNNMYVIYWLNGTVKMKTKCLARLKEDLNLIYKEIYSQ